MVHPGLPVVGEGTVLPYEALCEGLGQGRAVDLKPVLDPDALVPPAQEKAGVVDIVVGVMVGEEKVVYLRGPQARLHQLVGGGGTTIEHDVLPAGLDYVGGAETGRGRRRRVGRQRLTQRLLPHTRYPACGPARCQYNRRLRLTVPPLEWQIRLRLSVC